jgi:hypothetical protein
MRHGNRDARVRNHPVVNPSWRIDHSRNNWIRAQGLPETRSKVEDVRTESPEGGRVRAGRSAGAKES